VPLFLSIVYPTVFYVYVVAIYPCENVFSYRHSLCGRPCYEFQVRDRVCTIDLLRMWLCLEILGCFGLDWKLVVCGVDFDCGECGVVGSCGGAEASHWSAVFVASQSSCDIAIAGCVYLVHGGVGTGVGDISGGHLHRR
jgi:hypothetical protein